MTDGPALLRFDGARFDYDPYPVAWWSPVFDETIYRELVTRWPAKDLFEFMPKLGNKYSLSEVNRPDHYHRFIRETPCWRRVHECVKDPAFIRDTLAMLAAGGVDLGLARERVDGLHELMPPWRRAGLRLGRLLGRRRRRLRTRFEFSMMSADGGHIVSHTDHPTKRVTLVMSMCAPGEWNPGWGGGTAIQKPRDARDSYNEMNRQLPFEKCDVLREYPFEPNQAVVFIKTFNSLHAVYPMKGPAHALRRTLTVNIESLES
jgi:hypothetical protein